jgi:hypothetical protein
MASNPEQEKEYKDISISVNYGENAPKIKKQLNKPK